MHLALLFCAFTACRTSTKVHVGDTGPSGSLEETPSESDDSDAGEVDEALDSRPDDSGPSQDSGALPEDADDDGWSDDEDCDDADATIHPDADEHCDGRDEDCDDDVDEDAVDPATWWWDFDADGWGSEIVSHEGCAPEDGYVAETGDCDDVDAGVNPGADEVCSGEDEDCDGLVDDDDDSVDLGTATTWYADADADGYGDPDDSVLACDAPSAHVGSAGDCDDSDDDTYEGGEEICNDGVDNDCDDSSDGCALDTSYDLADADWVLRSNGENDHVAVVTSADLDGDGQDDLVVAAPDHDGGGSASGSLWVHAGPLTSGLVSDGIALTGGAAGDAAGSSLATADLDDDGQPDLVVGAPTASPGGAEEGQVHLILGPITAASELGASDTLVTASTADSALGCALATGDVDGDGVADLLIGSWGESGESSAGGGAWLVLGPITAASYDDSSADAIYTGPEASGYAGQAVATGDWDGDGTDDLAIAAAYADSYAGRVYATTSGSGAISLTDADALHTGEATGDFAGSSLSAGDLDGDGIEDLVVGAYGQDDGGTNAGAVYVVASPLDADASLAEAHATITGGSAGDLAGVASVVVGDVDGDGADDLLVGGSDADPGGSASGAAWLLYGPISGTTSLSAADVSVHGEASGDRAGSGLTGGDFDGTGYADLVITAPYDDTEATDGGAAYGILGQGF